MAFVKKISTGIAALVLLSGSVGIANASEPTYNLDEVVEKNTVMATSIESQEVIQDDYLYLSDSTRDKVSIYSSDNSATVNRIEREDGIQIVLELGSDKDSSFEFQFKGKYMRIIPSGHVLVSSEKYGEPEYIVDPAWAVDAVGNKVNTWYEVHGDTLKQVIKTSDTVYDVIADPYYRTAYTRGGSPMGQDFVFSRDETLNVATAGGLCATITAPFAPWVAVGCGGAGVIANHAHASGKCLVVRRITLTLLVFPMVGDC